MRNALLERQDMVAFHNLIDLTLLRMLRLLFALNRTYIRSSGFKWFRYNVSKLSINLEERIEAILTDPSEAVEEINALLHEVFELVKKHRPDIDVTQPHKTVNYLRQKIQINA
jgi:hypothetical protein